MKIKIVLILSIFLYLQLTTQDDVGIKNQIICGLSGEVWTRSTTYVFNIDELPERCQIFTVGQYAFNRIDGDNTYVMKSDKDIIRALVEANKPVYMIIGFDGPEEKWETIFDYSDVNVYQTEVFGPLVQFLNDFKISGVILYFGELYELAVDDLATKISCFANPLKEKVNGLVVGMVMDGMSHTAFTDNTLFDFSITNKVLDIYIIDWFLLYSCTNDAVKDGITPITSTDNTIVTLEQITSSVTNSCMDKSKIYGIIQMFPMIPETLLCDSSSSSITTYSIYCCSTDQSNSSQWCTSSSQNIYDQGEYAKKFYAGIILSQLDTDDYESNCGCGQYPIANIAIDGWTGSPFKDCPALN